MNETIALGTAQFGLDYGINNQSGQISEQDGLEIVELYHKSIKRPVYDSATTYGNSQTVLGQVFKKLKITDPAVISKFSTTDIVNGLEKVVMKTLGEIGVDQLYGFLAHDPASLIENEKNYQTLIELKKKGVINKVGISAYFPWQVEWFMNRNIALDLIQVPYSLFDQRFGKVIEKAASVGIEVHVRSVFTQGLLFKDVSFFSGYYSPFMNSINIIDEVCNNFHSTREHAALAFCYPNEYIARLVVGVDTVSNLWSNIEIPSAALVEAIKKISSGCAIHQEEVLLPFNWPKK